MRIVIALVLLYLALNVIGAVALLSKAMGHVIGGGK